MLANDLGIYNREADNWWKPDSCLSVLNHFNPPRFGFFDNFVTNWENVKVLDIGCGGGFTCEFLAKRGAVVSGIDVSEKSIIAGRRHAEEAGLNIEYRQGKAEDLPYTNDDFDVLICVDVLEHVSDLQKVISEIYRVLKHGGIFLFDTINKTFKSKVMMIWMLEYILKEIPRGVHDWNLFIKPEVLTSVLQENGFRDILIKGFNIRGKDKNTGAFNIEINDNTSVMYIGKCVKSQKP